MPKKSLIGNLLEGVQCKDPRTKPISISFNGAEKKRWNTLRDKVDDLENGSTLADYARIYLFKMMDDLEKDLDKMGRR